MIKNIYKTLLFLSVGSGICSVYLGLMLLGGFSNTEIEPVLEAWGLNNLTAAEIIAWNTVFILAYISRIKYLKSGWYWHWVTILDLLSHVFFIIAYYEGKSISSIAIYVIFHLIFFLYFYKNTLFNQKCQSDKNGSVTSPQ